MNCFFQALILSAASTILLLQHPQAEPQLHTAAAPSSPIVCPAWKPGDLRAVSTTDQHTSSSHQHHLSQCHQCAWPALSGGAGEDPFGIASQ